MINLYDFQLDPTIIDTTRFVPFETITLAFFRFKQAHELFLSVFITQLLSVDVYMTPHSIVIVFSLI